MIQGLRELNLISPHTNQALTSPQECLVYQTRAHRLLKWANSEKIFRDSAHLSNAEQTSLSNWSTRLIHHTTGCSAPRACFQGRGQGGTDSLRLNLVAIEIFQLFVISVRDFLTDLKYRDAFSTSYAFTRLALQPACRNHGTTDGMIQLNAPDKQHLPPFHT
jgi:hypothetical protein